MHTVELVQQWMRTCLRLCVLTQRGWTECGQPGKHGVEKVGDDICVTAESTNASLVGFVCWHLDHAPEPVQTPLCPTTSVGLAMLNEFRTAQQMDDMSGGP